MLFFYQSYYWRKAENSKKRNSCYLLYEQLVDGRVIFLPGRGSEACERFEFFYEVGLVEVAAVICDGGKRLVVLCNQLQAELETPDLVKGYGCEAGMTMDKHVQIAGGDAVFCCYGA